MYKVRYIKTHTYIIENIFIFPHNLGTFSEPHNIQKTISPRMTFYLQFITLNHSIQICIHTYTYICTYT